MSLHLIRDLDALHHSILSLCAMVEELVQRAVKGLGEPSAELADELARNDKEIDLCDVRIEEECLKMLALHQPVAIDLRRIAAVLKITGELERVADLGVHIAERACGMIGYPELRLSPRLNDMSRLSLGMLHRSIDAYVELNTELARKVRSDDDLVDALNREIIDELIDVMQANPNLIEPAMHLFSAVRHVERVADHATNIAEDVVYLVEGEIVRHRAVSEFIK